MAGDGSDQRALQYEQTLVSWNMFDELWPLGKTRLRRQIPQFNVARAALNISERRLRWRSIKLSFDRMDGALGAMLERRIGVCLNQSAPL